MEFHEKLQELRKRKNLTQEELAEVLYVSRTAVSKWESGRGYPNIESLKALAKVYSVTVDELLSGEELLSIAEADQKQKEKQLCNVVFGLLDICVAMLLFLPLFAQKAGDSVQSVPLLALTQISPYLRVTYFVMVAVSVLCGISMLLKNLGSIQHKISLAVGTIAAVVCIVSLQPYAAVLLFAFLMIKLFLLIRWK